MITNADGSTAEGNIAVPTEGSFVDNLNYGSSRVWTTPTCCPKQEEAVETIIFLEVCGGKLLVVDQTGSGKSHIFRMTATFAGGIILVIVPLLALTADQMVKIRIALQGEGSGSAYHLDDIPLELLLELIIPAMHMIGYDSSSTMFPFTSPQKLSATPQLLKALFECHER